MPLNTHIPNNLQIIGWLKRGVKRERNLIERGGEEGAGKGGRVCMSGGCLAGEGGM